MEAGLPYVYFNEKTNLEEEVSIPPNYSFKDLATAKVREEHYRFFKVLIVHVKAGDCIHIPAYWWYQIQTLTPKKPDVGAPDLF